MWLTLALLLRRPYGSDTVDPEEPAATMKGNRKVEEAIGERIQQAGAGEWMQLLRQVVREMDQPGRRGALHAPLGIKLCRTQQRREGSSKQRTAFCARPQVVSVQDTPEGLRKLAAVEVNEGERVRLKEAVKVVRRSVKEKARLTEGSFATE